jgi:ornithine carbamoyltransferase
MQKARIPYRPLRGRTLAMVFQKPSNRTRVSFEVGMYQLGGHALSLSPQEIQMGKRETPSDTGRVLARYIDAIMVRTFDHEELEELAGCLPTSPSSTASPTPTTPARPWQTC